ncbi:KAP family P-loop domain-containing protein [Nocardioides terrae]|uniref:KAP family P-loop domain-containing protein n=1 Tax=Nocardioides terrae TaxID=574651 RepID=A0A1I1P3H6_9ACTN|nr:KAP family NTPase [Nocardioides terrae]SFD04377.1 KAP family P-loop domain-containing protein [Nocardioides terrae]
MPTPWTDAPITAKSEDELDRAGYAVRAAQLIAGSHSWEDSIAFGLTGPWGSGKSSMLAMISEELNASYPSWQVARFTPWATGDVAGLLGDFYASLSQALPRRRSREIRNALGTLAQVSAPAANAIPWAGGAVASAAGSAGAALKKQTPWDKAFKTAAAELKKLDTPVLLIADDIDRLQTEELLALLKVVRLLGRFPGVHYLLAYDESTLFQALSEANLVGEDDGAAARFMEKIVQYPLVVPPLLSTQLLARLDAGLDAALAEAGRPQPSSGRLGRLVEVYRSQLGTPRAIDRYLAQLRHHLPLVDPEEIDDEDVIVLTLLRTAFPTLYQQLPRWRDRLISGHTSEIKRSTSTGVEYELFDIEPLLEMVPKNSRSDARALLTDLFPKLRSGGLSYASSDRGISDTRYFDRYFAMGIPSHDVSDVEVANATADVGHGNPSALTALLSQASPDRVVLVVDKGRRFTENLPEDDAGDALRLELVKLLVAVLDSVHDKPSFFMSPRERVAGWASHVVTQLSDKVPAAALLEALDAASKLAAKIEVVYFADRQEGPRPACLDKVIAELGVQATKEMVVHLEARDDAPEDVQPGSLIHFLLSAGQIAPLAAAVAEGLNSGAFTIADVAARVIPTRILYGVGTQYELSDFDQETFNALVPATPDPWYESPQTEVDKHNLSWANRRAYASGRAKQPPATPPPAAANTDTAADPSAQTSQSEQSLE